MLVTGEGSHVQGKRNEKSPPSSDDGSRKRLGLGGESVIDDRGHGCQGKAKASRLWERGYRDYHTSSEENVRTGKVK